MQWKRFGVRMGVATVFLAAAGLAGAQEHKSPVRPGVYDPIANSGAVVVEGNVRFTVLTPQMIRMEWAADGAFEDRPSFTFLNRKLPVPTFTTSREGGVLTLQTAALKLQYTGDGRDKFTADNLSVALHLDGKPVVWHPGSPSHGNLLGTTRTLDQARGDKTVEPMEPGLISRDGWAVVDDSTQPLFTGDDFSFPAGEKSPWPWVVRRSPGERQDLYFFGYGHEYAAALEDYRRVSGPVPLPPRWAFGAWWTRYWQYTDHDLLDLVKEYREASVPLDVLVIDMDWHVSHFQLAAMGARDQSGQSQFGWTGYTWNKSLFPYPADFLHEIHADGLKVSLNLHPASGVQPYEEAYPAMARAMGIDPATKKYVPFDILNQKFAQNYMDVLHHPLEKQGVDFWWLDWQQARIVNTPGVNSTWWLNYVHFTDQQREGKRPLLFGRWGGMGDHRYQTGFTGDVIIGWDSLAFQPYFTATAANVAYAYWSHDIGGHLPGPTDPELYTRWVQWGAFSPILRTHSAISPYGERRLWAYPEPYSNVMRDAFQMRYALLPYVYTEARRTYDTGVAFLRPLYYSWPEQDGAYRARDEYLFGDNMIAAPVVTPADPHSKLATETVWMPPGEWIEQNTGKHFNGPAEVERHFGIDEIPLYVRAGSIVPKAPPMLRTDEKPIDPLILEVQSRRVDGVSSYTVYDDGNDAEKYQTGEAAWTTVSATTKGPDVLVTVGAETGKYPGMPLMRGYEIRLPGSWPPETVTANGKPLTYQAVAGTPGWRYDGYRLETIVTVPRSSVRVPVHVSVHTLPALATQRWKLDGLQGVMARMHNAQQVVTSAFPIVHAPDVLDDAAETGVRLTYHPETAEREVDHLLAIYAQVQPAVEEAQKDSPKKIHDATLHTLPDEKSEAFKVRATEYADKLVASVAVIEDSKSDVPRKP